MPKSPTVGIDPDSLGRLTIYRGEYLLKHKTNIPLKKIVSKAVDEYIEQHPLK